MNSEIIIKFETASSLKEFKRLTKLYNKTVEDYLKNDYYFQNIEEMIDDNNMNIFSKLNIQYFELAKEFRQFVLRYDVRHKKYQNRYFLIL